jgi:hypothetical protein
MGTCKNYHFDGIGIKVCFDDSVNDVNAPKDLSDKDKETIKNIIKDIRLKKDV